MLGDFLVGIIAIASDFPLVKGSSLNANLRIGMVRFGDLVWLRETNS
jgi:hypothetical protein